MQILSLSQIRAWDEYTIQHEPITSLDLIERAASALEQWILNSSFSHSSFAICCGKGNNGGDGLALARLLAQRGQKVTVYITEHGRKGSPDFQSNLIRLHETAVQLIFLSSAEHFHPFAPNEVIIDALLGSGLNRAVEGLEAELIHHINGSGRPVISIDVPSGMYADQSSLGQTVIKATHTLSFECLKLAFMLPENAPWFGTVHVLPIRLHPDFPKLFTPEYRILSEDYIRRIFRPRPVFGHKGSFGHAAVIAGQKGMMGAAVLAVKACMRTGAGKVTGVIPESGLNVLQIAVPEALTAISGKDHWEVLPALDSYQAVGVGPGIGTGIEQDQLLQQLISSYKGKLVVDADALTLLAKTKAGLSELPAGSILTPHPGEWKRLSPAVTDDFNRLKAVDSFADKHNCIVVLKGHRSYITDGRQERWFNSTGNSGLAKAGTGDVLTGMIASLLAQGYSPLEAAQLGVYFHGAASDYLGQQMSKSSALASDLVDAIGQVMYE